MKLRSIITPSLAALLVVAGCASTKVTQHEAYAARQKLPRPNRILIHAFGATAAYVPADSALSGQYAAAPQTPAEVATGRDLGALIAKNLVADIKAMGLTAEPAATAAAPQIGDLVIKGYFLSIDEGSAAKRIAIGFGSGGAKLETVVEGYQMTSQGLRKLGSGAAEAGAGKAPGAVVPAAVALASGNPIGLVVSSAVKVQGELSGRTTIEGRAKSTAAEIAEALKMKFQQQGWIR